MAEIWLALLLVATLGAVDPAASQITVANVKGAWTTFATITFATELSNCDSACPSNVVTTAPAAAETDLDPLCQKIIVYSDCVQNTCTTPFGATELGALEDQCKTANLETAMTAIKGNCDKCDTQEGAVNSASELEDKCVASLSFIKCAATQTDCSSSVPPADVQALKDACKGIPHYDFESALTAIKATCPSDKCDSTAVDGATGLDDKCLASETYLTCLTDGTSCISTNKVPDDDLEALKTPCKDTTTTTATETTTVTAPTTVDPFVDVKDKWSTFKTDQDIPTSCADTTCTSAAVDNAKDVDALCEAIGIYFVCAKANCSNTLTDTHQLDEMNDQCKTASALGGDDDGCSILQVSTLALMLSLLLSII